MFWILKVMRWNQNKTATLDVQGGDLADAAGIHWYHLLLHWDGISSVPGQFLEAAGSFAGRGREGHASLLCCSCPGFTLHPALHPLGQRR